MRGATARLLSAAALLLVFLSGCPRNSAPDVPAAPTGPTSGYPDSTYAFSASAFDPDGDSVALVFSWGDGDKSPLSDHVPGGCTVEMSHVWDTVGSYAVTVCARDILGLLSGWSQALEVSIVARPNTPPLAPCVPDGPEEALEDSVCSFRVTGTDPENDRVAYRFSWGDGDTSEWSDFLGPDVFAVRDHSWACSGTFAVRAQAKDEFGVTSAWSDSLTVAVYPAYPYRRIAAIHTDFPTDALVLPGGEYLYVANGHQCVVSVYRTSDLTLAATVPVGDLPYSLTAIPDGGYVYVANRNSDNVSVIRTSDNTVVATIPVTNTPEGIVALPTGEFVYVSNHYAGSVSVIDTETNGVVAEIPVGRQPIGFACLPTSEFVYVACDWFGTVDVISTKMHAVVATVPDIGGGLYDITVSTDGEHVYVSACQSEHVVVIRTSDNSVEARVPSGGPFGPYGLGALPNGQYVFVAGWGSDRVRVLRTADNTYVDAITVCSVQENVAASPDGGRLYVTHFDVDSVSVLGFPACGFDENRRR